MNEFRTLESVVDLLGNAPETQFLEFKIGLALDDIGQVKVKDEIVRDVSAFANAGGGTIIYGVKESRSVPALAVELSPVMNSKVDTLRLVNIIRSGMEPVFNGFDVHEIIVPTGGRIIVVSVDKAQTAHQCKSDHKYYQRNGPSGNPMYDHQIRDVMNRRIGPVINLKPSMRRIQQHSKEHIYELYLELVNDGPRTAHLWMLEVILPDGLGAEQSGSFAWRPSIPEYPNYGVWEYSCERNAAGKRAVLLPGQTHGLTKPNGYTPVQLIVNDENYRSFRDTRPPIVFRLYVDECLMRESSLSFDEWCNY